MFKIISKNVYNHKKKKNKSDGMNITFESLIKTFNNNCELNEINFNYFRITLKNKFHL